MKKSILIIGFETNHSSMYLHLLILVQPIVNKIVFVTNNDIYMKLISEMPVNKVSFIIKRPEENTMAFIKFNLTNEYIDVLILDEPYDWIINYISLLKNKAEKLFIIHNFNNWKQLKISSPKNFINNILRLFFIKKFSSFLVVGYNTYLHNLKKYGNQIYLLSFSTPLYNNIYQKKTSKKISIVIPGTINLKRRNYQIIIDAFKIHKKEYPFTKIQLVLLGIPSEGGREILSTINSDNNICNHFTTFNDFIPDSVFNEYLYTCDYFLENIIPIIKINGIKEEYGVTKETGLTYIIANYPKIVISQRKLVIPKLFESQTLKYEDTLELANIFEQILLNDPKLERLKDESIINSLKFKVYLKNTENILLNYLSDN